MNRPSFIANVVAHAGQGLFVDMQEHLGEGLRGQLAEWSRLSPI